MDERYLRWVMATAAVLGVIGTIVSAVVFRDLSIVLGTAFGVSLAIGNLWMLQRMGKRLLHQQGATGKTVGLMFLKFTLLIGAIGVAVLLLPINKLALMAGFSVVVVSITLGTIIGPTPEGDGSPEEDNSVGAVGVE